LTSEPIEFQTLEGETIRFASDALITPQTVKVFEGKGMPILNNDPLSPLLMNHSRGNFILRFQIEFPNSLPDEKKNKLITVLKAVA